jgi:hypothetical protein
VLLLAQVVLAVILPDTTIWPAKAAELMKMTAKIIEANLRIMVPPDSLVKWFNGLICLSNLKRRD